jgi:CBS domain-containing protein/Zn-dependent protease
MKQGIPVSSITLFLFGGVSQIMEEPKGPGNEAKMATVGPLSSFAISAVFMFLWFASEAANLGPFIIAPLSYIATINLLLGGFNLLPAFPLDGGRVLRAGIWSWKKNLIKATQLSTRISEAIAYAMIGLGFASIFFVSLISGIWLVFIGWFLKNGSEAALKQTIISQSLSKVKVDEIMNSQVGTIPPDITVAEASEQFFEKSKHGGYPVVDEKGAVLGIITKSDIQNIAPENKEKNKIREVMTPKEKVISISPDDPAVEAMLKFSRHEVGRLLVLENGRLVGIVTRSDLMRAIQNER